MKYFKKIILVLLFLFPISNSFGAMVTEVDDQQIVFEDGGSTFPNGITFNDDGTKMFVSFSTSTDNSNFNFINEYNLSTPFDISTHTYAGDDERCDLDVEAGSADLDPTNVGDMAFSSDGLKIFFVNRGLNNVNNDAVYRYDLTTPYDVSTCTFVEDEDPDTEARSNGWRHGDRSPAVQSKSYHVQGIEINPDGTKIFLSFNGVASGTAGSLDGIREYNLSTPYDLSTMSQVTSAGILLTQSNPDAIFFGLNGKRIFVTDHLQYTVTQYSLSTAYDTSSSTLDGAIVIKDFITTKTANQIRALAFSASGLKMFVSDDNGSDTIHEFDLVCPFNIIAGNCPSITENSDRTGMAEAQIEIAKRTIDHSTDTALNRLKWIRRNKDKQNLTNLNNFNTSIQFYNPLLNYWVKKFPDKLVAVNEAVEGGRSITIGREYKKRNKNSNNLDNFNTAIKSDNPLLNSWLNKLPEKITAHLASVEKKTEDKKQDLFFWSEGSIAVGRIGDTSISSTKKIGTDAITVGADKFTSNNGIKGLAFRVGRNDVDVGTTGSNLDTDTYNITYYATSPVEDDTKFIDTIIGFGKLKSDLLTVLDGKNLTADRTGNQLYGTIKIKDEIKKDNLILIPSGRFDYGHTILSSYKESGNGAIDVKKQHVRTKKLRAAIAIVEDLSSDKYTFKRHGKFEYVVDIDRSSNFKYRYVSDSSTSFDDTLHTGALHNLSGEIGFDIIFPDHYSIFVIYERNHAFGSGYTDNIHIALGYLPYKDTEFAFSVDGSDNLMSQFEIKKNINGYDFGFNLKNDLTNLGNDQEASINLSKVF